MVTNAASLLLLDNDRKSLEFAVTKGPKKDLVKKYKLRVGEGIAGWVVKTGKPILVNDVAKDKRWKRDIAAKIGYETNNVLCAPLIVRDKTIGAIEVINKNGVTPFTKDDLEVLSILANNIAIVLENAKLFELSDRKATELNTISEVSKRMNSVLKLDDLLKTIMQLAANLMNTEASSILLVDRESNELQFKIALGEKGEKVKRIRLKVGEGIAGYVAKHKRPLIVNDARNDPRFDSRVDHQSGFKTRAILCVPMMSRENLIGVIEVMNKRGNISFSQHDEELLSIFAGHSAIAIENARLYESLREQERQRCLYERFLSPPIVNEIINQSKSVTLGGNRQEVTILFADIREFSRIVESREPEYVVDLLNEFFGIMVDIVFKYEGTLDKFTGDGLMAIFGAPIKHDNDPERAIRTAIEMQRKLRDFSMKKEKKGDEGLYLGIGINTGEAIVGNIGSERRMEYTVIGNAVNVANRIQCLAQGGEILVTHRTYEKLLEQPNIGNLVEVKPLKQIQVRGKEGPMDIYTVIRLKGEDTIRFV
jgi:adenylate cyclase